jgi:hypothetical protein
MITTTTDAAQTEKRQPGLDTTRPFMDDKRLSISGVIQQRALDGRRRSFHALAAV